MRIGIDARMVDWSGVGRYTQGLLTAISEFDRENEYFLYYSSGKKELLPSAPNFNYIEAKKAVFSFNGIRELSRLVQKSSLNLFHSVHFPTPIFSRCPLVVTIHDLIPLILPEVMPRKRNRQIYRFLNWLAVRRAKKIIAISQNTQRDLERFFPFTKGKINVVYRWVEEKFFREENSSLSKETPFILATGNQKPSKNLSLLVEAFADIVFSSPLPHNLLLIGPEDSNFPQVKEMIQKNNLQKRVFFTELLSDEELIKRYQSADIFVFPSLYEGFGLPPLEAMACQTPVIASRAASLPEVLDDAAILINPHDKKELSEAISKVLGDEKLRSTLKRKGTQQARKFSREKAIKETLAIYKEVAGERS